MHQDRFAQLTKRELQCLEGVRDRHDVREISDRLGITINTVNTYLDSARRKLGARNRNAAVRMLLEHQQPASSKSISGFAGIEAASEDEAILFSRGSEEWQGVLRDVGAIDLDAPRPNALPLPFATRGRRRNDLAIGHILGLIAAIAVMAVLIVGVLIQSLLGLGALNTSLRNLF